MDLIDRQELMKSIRCRKNRDCEHCDFYTSGDSWCDGTVFGTTIMQMPTVEPKRGECDTCCWHDGCSWEDLMKEWNIERGCCAAYSGADMRGEEE